MYDDIALFVHIVRQQGLLSAAQKLNIPPATVTRRLKKLEKTLRVQLIHRSARQFTLTPEGHIYFEAYAELVSQLDATSNQLQQEISALAGPLKVLAPTNLSLSILQPMWCEFVNTYPDIQLNLQLNNHLEAFLPGQADIALRVGPQKDEALYQQRLGSLDMYLIASKKYLDHHGTPDSVDALLKHRLIGTSLIRHWSLTYCGNKLSTDKSVMLQPEFAICVNDIAMATQFAAAGAGIALAPVSELLQLDSLSSLARVMPDWKGPERVIYAVWSTGKLLNARAKCLKSFMQQYIEQHVSGLSIDWRKT